MRVLLLAVALSLSACGPAKVCSYVVDCTCQCQDCSGGSCSPLTKQYFGHACSSAEGQSDCPGWAAGQKDAVEQRCIQDCNDQIGIAEITCDFAQTPGNPVATTASVACPVR